MGPEITSNKRWLRRELTLLETSTVTSIPLKYWNVSTFAAPPPARLELAVAFRRGLLPWDDVINIIEFANASAKDKGNRKHPQRGDQNNKSTQ